MPQYSMCLHVGKNEPQCLHSAWRLLLGLVIIDYDSKISRSV